MNCHEPIFGIRHVFGDVENGRFFFSKNGNFIYKKLLKCSTNPKIEIFKISQKGKIYLAIEIVDKNSNFFQNTFEKLNY